MDNLPSRRDMLLKSAAVTAAATAVAGVAAAASSAAPRTAAGATVLVRDRLPSYSHWVGDAALLEGPSSACPAPQLVLPLRAPETAAPVRLQLLDDLPTGPFRVTADVRHLASGIVGTVGLYAGDAVLSFDDRGDPVEGAVRFGTEVKTGPSLRRKKLWSAAIAADPKAWRQLVIERTGDIVRWSVNDGKGGATRSGERKLSLTGGGLGIYVYGASAAFRNVVVSPLT